MKKLMLYLVLFFLISSLAYAITVEVGTVFDDGCCIYTVNTQFTVDDILIENCEIYFDGIPYCDWYGKDWLTTDCSCEPPPAIPFFSTVGLIGIMSTLVIVGVFMLWKIKKDK